MVDNGSMEKTSPIFESGHYVKILSGVRKDEEAKLDNPLSSRNQTWVVTFQNGKKEFYAVQDLLPLKTSSVEEFRRFLEN